MSDLVTNSEDRFSHDEAHLRDVNSHCYSPLLFYDIIDFENYYVIDVIATVLCL